LELTPVGVISGKVLGTDGNPLADTVVLAINSGFIGGNREFGVVKRVYANDLGEYRLYDLPPGRYYVSAVHRDGLDAGTGIAMPFGGAAELLAEEGYAPTYYPNAMSLADATLLSVRPGTVLGGVDITLSNFTKVRLRGRVLVPGDVKLNRPVTVSLIPADLSMITKYSRQSADTQVDTGEFELQAVPPGAYILAADWLDGGTHYSAKQTVDVGRTSMEGVVLALLPALHIDGQVHVEGEAKFDFSGLQVSLHTAGPGAMTSGGVGEVSQNGSFTIDNLRLDHYFVSMSGLGANYYLKAVYLQKKDATQSGIDLTQSPADTIDLLA
jgi:hypothetical protein